MQEWKVSGQKRIDIESRFRPEIEGLRTVAALLVAMYHIWFNRVSGGVDADSNHPSLLLSSIR